MRLSSLAVFAIIAFTGCSESTPPREQAKKQSVQPKQYTEAELKKEVLGLSAEQLRDKLGAPSKISSGDDISLWFYDGLIVPPSGAKSVLVTISLHRGIVNGVATDVIARQSQPQQVGGQLYDLYAVHMDGNAAAIWWPVPVGGRNPAYYVNWSRLVLSNATTQQVQAFEAAHSVHGFPDSSIFP